MCGFSGLHLLLSVYVSSLSFFSLYTFTTHLNKNKTHTQVHIAYPPNMPTPGFEEEEKTKPAEAKAIEGGTVATVDPALVARSIITDMRNGNYHIPCCFDFNLLLAMMAGITPRNNPLFDFILAPFLIPISAVYRYIWDAEVLNKKYKQKSK